MKLSAGLAAALWRHAQVPDGSGPNLRAAAQIGLLHGIVQRIRDDSPTASHPRIAKRGGAMRAS